MILSTVNGILRAFYFENALADGSASAVCASEEQAKLAFTVYSECSVSKFI